MKSWSTLHGGDHVEAAEADESHSDDSHSDDSPDDSHSDDSDANWVRSGPTSARAPHAVAALVADAFDGATRLTGNGSSLRGAYPDSERTGEAYVRHLYPCPPETRTDGS